MKQKCILSKKKNTLVIREVAQTEPGSFSLQFETEVDTAVVEDAVKEGVEAVIEMFRNQHFYPIRFFAERIAQGLISMFTTEPADSLHIEFNDLECLQAKPYEAVEPDKIENEKELAEIDKLLEDDDTFDIEIDAGTSNDASNVSIDDSPEV